MTYCNAGHPPAIIKRANNTLVLLDSTAPVLGIFKNICRCEQVVLGKKDSLIIYTDGLIEARNDKEFFTEDRLFELVAEAEADTPDDIANHIFEKVSSFSNGELSDDIVIMTMSLGDKTTVKLTKQAEVQTADI